jgi:predicted SprT family Zn-dependent metalloprotease
MQGINKMVINNQILEAQHEAQEILDYSINTYNLKPIKIKVKNINKGRAYYLSRFISIPSRAYDKGLTYFYYYVLHEIAHFICYDKFNNSGHSNLFKGIETELLEDFDIIAEYKKVYIKRLLSRNRQVVYSN